MNRSIIAAAFLVAFTPMAPAQFNVAVLKVEATVEPATVRRGETATWRVTVELAPGWHTYPTVQQDPAASSMVTKFVFPSSKEMLFVGDMVARGDLQTKAEPAIDIKELRFYEGQVTWEQSFVMGPDAKPGQKSVVVPVTLVVCNDSGCLPPHKVETTAKVTVTDAPPLPVDPKYAAAFNAMTTIPAANAPSPPTPGANAPGSPGGDYAKALAALEERIETTAVKRDSGLAGFLLTAVAWGLISLVTPCVFPMIPITVSFFLKQSEKQHLNPVLQAFVYCGTIVVVLGVAALTLLSVFRQLSINPWTNVVLGLLFIVLALSLFGMFELTLPNSLTRWTSSREGQGGLIGTVFMALTFTIVSFTCVAPFLGGFAGIMASGQFGRWEMLLGALAFSGAFAAPFFLLALFPSALRRLPRSGGWLNAVKVVMGFLELAAALAFFRAAELRWLPEPVFFTYDFTLGLWVALSLVCGLYLLNLFRLGHDEVQESIGVPRMLWGLAFLGLAFYMLPGIFRGGAEGERQRPGGAVFAWIDAFLLPDPTQGGVAHGDLRWTADLPQAVTQARDAGKKVFVDFTGVTCKNCKYNERQVFTRPEVRELFKQYQLVQMYTDTVPAEFYPQKTSDEQREKDAAANLDFQKRKFGNEQLPLYVILDPQPGGKVVPLAVYDEGKINKVDQFVEFLKRPLAPETGRAQR
jgi:thiol:disulfide interchange protein DsbD